VTRARRTPGRKLVPPTRLAPAAPGGHPAVDGHFAAVFTPDQASTPPAAGNGRGRNAVRVIEYYVTVEGQVVPEMFCLVTDLLDYEDYPGPELAALYKWRWDGSQTALREAKAPLRGAGPGTGPMLRSAAPDLIWQELAAWAAATAMTRAVIRDAALAAVPARKGRRAGLLVRPRDLSCARAVRAILHAIRLGHDCYQAVTSEIARHRNVIGRSRHRPRKSKSPSAFDHASLADRATRIAPAVITMANTTA
jgi:hypothetical protein